MMINYLCNSGSMYQLESSWSKRESERQTETQWDRHRNTYGDRVNIDWLIDL